MKQTSTRTRFFCNMNTTKVWGNKPTITINPAPLLNLQNAYDTVFSKEALDFVAELVTTFKEQVDELHWNRLSRICEIRLQGKLPKFVDTAQRRDKTWRVAAVPERLQNVKLVLGDVSPANTQHFIKSLSANVQGVQVDFDDGHCPTWKNQIIGLYNVYKVVHGEFYGVCDNIRNTPILMLRPRAWNMIDHNVMINGKVAPGPLVDFGILMYHNSRILSEAGAGPFFYLSKLESAFEAKLWNDIFIWTQKRLNLVQGTIKACVLIENILAAFEMDEILYQLREHSCGLNCGIWDYSATIISKFGDNPDFILPDRNKYVNIQRRFLQKYMQCVVQTCHARGTFATGGMAAGLIVDDDKTSHVIQTVRNAKKLEILAGVDGFMIYELKLVPYMIQLWYELCGTKLNQLDLKITEEEISEKDLLEMPAGGVTYEGLKHNIEVAILFIYHWFKGEGHFYYKGAVEDSATAEISRSQVWQWIRHKAIINESSKEITKELVQRLAKEYVEKNKELGTTLFIAADLFMEIVTARYFIDFITTYLNDNYLFRSKHSEHINMLQLKPKL